MRRQNSLCTLRANPLHQKQAIYQAEALAKTEPESTREKEAKHLLNEALSSSLISHLTDHSLRTDHSLWPV